MFRRALRSLAARQQPHGGKLMENIILDKQHHRELIKSCDGRILRLNERQSCDVELLTNGGFSPLKGFMNEDVYNSCVKDMRLPDSKLLWGIPVVLDCDGTPKIGERWLLQWGETPLGVIDIESKWRPLKEVEAKHCYRVTTIEHPGVRMISMERGPYYVGGTVTGLEGAQRVFPCSSPKELRASLPGGDVVAFQCRNPIHRAHFELFMRALEAPNVERDGVVLVHPTVGPTQEDDIPGDVRYHTYEALKKQLASDPKYQEQNKRVRWGYLPYSMHMAGPREAIQHMIIRKNFGCTHFIIGRDMAGSKSSITGDDFYGAYDAQDFAKAHAPELDMQTVPSLNLVYTDEAGFVEDEQVKSQGYHVKKLSGTEFRRKLRAGEDIPEWFAFPSVVNVLREHVKSG